MEWISVKDSMPPMYDFVLVKVYYKKYTIGRGSWVRFKNRWWIEYFGVEGKEEQRLGFVTHWMPLPEHPKDL